MAQFDRYDGGQKGGNARRADGGEERLRPRAAHTLRVFVYRRALASVSAALWDLIEALSKTGAREKKSTLGGCAFQPSPPRYSPSSASLGFAVTHMTLLLLVRSKVSLFGGLPTGYPRLTRLLPSRYPTFSEGTRGIKSEAKAWYVPLFTSLDGTCAYLPTTCCCRPQR